MEKKPKWIRIRSFSEKDYQKYKNLLDHFSFHTVCEEASCPNIRECLSKGCATFLILGKICTRNCAFCGIQKGVPKPPDLNESSDIATAVQMLGLNYTIITSVTRDDLPDGGANQFANTIDSILKIKPKAKIEILIPDFYGNKTSLKLIAAKQPNVINHNLETVQRLYCKIRPNAKYSRSMNLLSNIKKLNPEILTKSGIMLGFGEKIKEVLDLMHDLREVDCDMITIGQYLSPSPSHVHVKDYIHPNIFQYLKIIGYSFGFKSVASGPLVRSSYQAFDMYRKAKYKSKVEGLFAPSTLR